MASMFLDRKVRIIFGLCFVSTSCFAQHMIAKDGPCQGPSTNADQYECFYAASKKSDAALNKLYRRIQTVLEGNELVKLEEAQRLWIRFQSANCDAEHELFEGGSAGPVVKIACLEAGTRHRTEDLHLMYGWRLGKWRLGKWDE
jgi:uncharacterized protein YecT (DUF1311 family)